MWAYGPGASLGQSSGRGEREEGRPGERGRGPSARCGQRRGGVLLDAQDAGPLMAQHSTHPGGASRVRRRALLGTAVLAVLVALAGLAAYLTREGRSPLRYCGATAEFAYGVLVVRGTVRAAHLASRSPRSAEDPRSDHVREGRRRSARLGSSTSAASSGGTSRGAPTSRSPKGARPARTPSRPTSRSVPELTSAGSRRLLACCPGGTRRPRPPRSKSASGSRSRST